MPILPTSRLALPFCLLISAAFLYSSVQAEPPAKPIDASEGSAQHDGRHDFDFELGRWNAHVKKLVHPLSHSTEWDELTGTVVTRTLPMLEGWNESEMRVESPTSHRHLELLAVRLYNPSTRQWAIYGSSITTGVFDPPMIGQFSNGRGELYSQDTFQGRAIYVRFIWQRVDANRTRLEQAFSEDGGKTWETNWIYEGQRIPQ